MDDRGLGRAKTFRASMRSAAAVCRELCVAKRRRLIIIIIIMTWTKRAQTVDRVHLSRALQPDFDGRTVQFLIR